jgi:hypothetical protein
MENKETILDKLYVVFQIKKLENGNYEFEENCDNYFSQELTKEEIQQLIVELQELIK